MFYDSAQTGEYLHNWKNADYELKDNKYWLKVILLADGEEYIGKFLLSNPSKSLKNLMKG